MTDTRKQAKRRKSVRAQIVRLERKDKIAALSLSILVLQQQMETLNVEEFNEGMKADLEGIIVEGNKVRIIGGLRLMGELCTVIDVTKKCVWVRSDEGQVFLKRKNHVVIESQEHTLKKEDE